MKHKPIDILKQVYGYDRFRSNQENIINSILSGKDTLALLPTGGGKSLCYQIPGLVRDGICVVISPLIALMQDQVNQLKQRGIKAIALTGGISYRDLDEMLDNCIYGNYKFLYMSPERLKQSLVQTRLKRMNINLIAIDEAHCISQWGHDFRPAYRDIATLKDLLGDIPMIAVTATATQQVRQDIVKNLKIDDAQVFVSSFKRDNISYRKLDTPDKRMALLSFYKSHSGSSITYVRSRKNTLEFSHLLNNHEIAASQYHGGLDHKTRNTAAQRWMKNRTQVMVATNAFGMGIDKPDVRSVVHLQLPESIESYYQETGRCGRDGKSSVAQFIYNINDLKHAHNQFIKALPTVAILKEVYKTLHNYLQVAMHEGADTVHDLSFAIYCRRYKHDPTVCYQALLTLNRLGIIEFNQQGGRGTVLRFRESVTTINTLTSNDPKTSAIIQSLLRTHGGSTQQENRLNIGMIATRSNVTEDEVVALLQALEAKELIDLQLGQSDMQVTLLLPRDDDHAVSKYAPLIKQQNQVKTQQLQAMMALLQENKKCLQQIILEYFDEKHSTPCGTCSNCLKQTKSQSPKNISLQILNMLSGKCLSAQELVNALHVNLEEVLTAVKSLMEQQKITITSHNKYKLNG
ncbi:RecQ family ATP-dependent DNA helicase [Nonlabens ponticola]|uniref:ATP-dependent DNA helicase RecQ n=1 Tax=Nonlabens ponticola TaxID=2496866 RepID=A0A3S9MYW1_9FLAO|nr:ATP-dependent DNA helicase RecQ [Nonlabens ponticola]AZQ44446.1 RecQ family ATP-dependent DNA helicase [Nonlabens ponticola]